MARTADILATAPGAFVQIVAAIEGYDVLLTEQRGSVQDALVGAWGATDWAGALGGLFVQWNCKQDVKPWDASMTIGSVVLEVMDDITGKDRFGIDANGSRAGTQTQLTAAINATDTSIPAKNPGSVTSPVWIGLERITFSGTTGTALTGAARGTFAPFRAGSETFNRCGRNHSIPDVNNARQAQVAPVIATKPRAWIGRRVGVWLHVSTDGGATFNSQAEAQLMFAGRIASVRDASNGSTIVECVDIRQEILDCILLRDQYVGKVQEGVVLSTGQTFKATDYAGTNRQTTLTVVNAAPATSYQVQTGVYALAEFAAVLNKWFAQAKADGNLNFNWQFAGAVTDTAGNTRSQFTWSHTTAAVSKLVYFAAPSFVMQFLGWGYVAYWNGGDNANATWSQVSPEEPYRILPTISNGDNQLYVEHTGGSWIDNSAFLPQNVQGTIAGRGSQWGTLKLSTGAIALAQKGGTFVMTNGKTVDLFTVLAAPQLAGLGSDAVDLLIAKGVRASQGDVQVDVSQTAVLEGTLADLLTRFLVSTGVANYNNISGSSVSHDSLAEQLGAAIPSSLLGTTWEASINALDAGSIASGMLFVIDRPTKLWDLIKTDMIARRAHVVWRDGGLQAVTWSTPTAGTAVWNFTESNKAIPAGTVDDGRVPAELSDEYAVPMVKLSYNRLPDGSYRDSITIVDRNALDDAGNASRVLTLEMRNSYGGFVATGQTVEKVAADIAAWLPLLSRPLRRLRRSLSLEHVCQLAPADQCTVNDEFARNPTTGARGLTAQPALVLSASWDLGGPSSAPGAAPRPFSAEADVLLLPTDRIAVYSPCAEVDSGAAGAGYNAGTKVLTFLAHEHSLSSEPADATRFAIGDKVRVVEVDPATAASPLTWTDTVAAQSANTVTLTTGLSGPPAYDTTKRYRMFADHYGAATATQKAKVFQGAAATNLIESVQDAFQYGWGASNSPVAWPHETPSTPPALYSIYDYGDGYPLHPGSERDAVRLINNLINYRTAVVNPVLGPAMVSPAGTYVRAILGVPMPKFIGLGQFLGLITRKLYVGPFARNTHASSKTLIVTLSRFFPVGTSTTLTSITNPEYQFVGPYVQATFTLAGAAGWGALTAQALDVRVCDQLDEGIGWLTIEGTGDNTGGIECRGFAEMRLGPLVAA